jgi:hypothetical protein
MRSFRFIVGTVVVAALGIPNALPAGWSAAQQKDPKPPKEEEEWKPASVPADALKYAVELEHAATPEFKAWCREHVVKHMRSQPVSPRAAMKAVDDAYPSTSDIARDAGIFLLKYLAYKDEDENQRVLAGQIREIDRRTYDISREINILNENEQRRLGTIYPRAAISAEQRIRMEEEIRKREDQLRQYGTERQMRSAELDASRKKVNLYLRVLGVVFERMQDVPVASIAELK